MQINNFILFEKSLTKRKNIYANCKIVITTYNVKKKILITPYHLESIALYFFHIHKGISGLFYFCIFSVTSSKVNGQQLIFIFFLTGKRGEARSESPGTDIRD